MTRNHYECSLELVLKRVSCEMSPMIQLYVLAYLHKDDQVLLLRRCNATVCDGLYSLPGGKVEQDECARAAIVREVQEETGLVIPQSAYKLVHTLHKRGIDGPLIALCFKVDVTGLGEPINAEPDKHDDMGFFPLDALPTEMIHAHKQALECITQKYSYSEHSW